MQDITTHQTVTPTPEGPEKPSILYVDDQEDNNVVFKSTFRRYFKVFTAMSGEEGLRIINAEDILIVIVDQRMPKMSGVQFLKNLPEHKDAVRIIVSGYPDTNAILDAINNANVYRYIMKPWDKEAMVRMMQQAVEELKARRANATLIAELKARIEELEREIEALKAEGCLLRDGTGDQAGPRQS
ncbi:response regulator [Rufibacter psychrotolerans]|uniref:response regulator n=1 Tax=Rufibacter psychrotolerans TaxID=2812556 RepID=UPI001967B604|nr:response regulator [Rufibacter sp. SYSU D00308]